MFKFIKQNALIIIGCLILAGIGVNYSINLYASKATLARVKSELRSSPARAAESENKPEAIPPVLSLAFDDETLPPNDAPQADEAAAVNAKAVGIMEIPKIDLESPIREGESLAVLKTSLGHSEKSAPIGETGNCVIYGHRAYLFGQFFSRLDEMEAGDLINVTTADDDFSYEVTDIFVIEPNDRSVLKKTEAATITLITCTPRFSGTHRLVVKGELVDKTAE